MNLNYQMVFSPNLLSFFIKIRYVKFTVAVHYLSTKVVFSTFGRHIYNVGLIGLELIILYLKHLFNDYASFLIRIVYKKKLPLNL